MRAAFEIEDAPDASARARRIVRSYGLPLLIALAFLLMTLLVPTVDRTVPADPTPTATSPESPGDAMQERRAR